MRVLPWLLLPLVLAGGGALGYFAQEARTHRVTVLETVTAQPAAPREHLLVATVRAKGGVCLSSDKSYAGLVKHTFALRRPGTALAQGPVVAVSESVGYDRRRCNLRVTFRIRRALGFFVVTDEQSIGLWGPFDSRRLPAHGWRLLLDET